MNMDNLKQLGLDSISGEKMMDKSKKLEIYKKMCINHYFEKQLIRTFNNSLIKCPIYLSIGQESIAATISACFKPDFIFAQHRAHSTYLSFGGNISKLIDELLGKDSGCSMGRGGSPGIQDEKIGMIGHHGLIGENVPLAVGASLGDRSKKIICFFGDGAAEEDYVFTSMAFAITHHLPILFICEDNDLSILTKKSERRSWEITDAVRSIGMPSVDIVDDPNLINYYVEKFKDNLPAFINCRTIRHHWHTGVGVDNKPEFDRLELFRKELSKEGLEYEISEIEDNAIREIEGIWENHLQKL